MNKSLRSCTVTAAALACLSGIGSFASAADTAQAAAAPPAAVVSTGVLLTAADLAPLTAPAQGQYGLLIIECDAKRGTTYQAMGLKVLPGVSTDEVVGRVAKNPLDNAHVAASFSLAGSLNEPGVAMRMTRGGQAPSPAATAELLAKPVTSKADWAKLLANVRQAAPGVDLTCGNAKVGADALTRSFAAFGDAGDMASLFEKSKSEKVATDLKGWKVVGNATSMSLTQEAGSDQAAAFASLAQLRKSLPESARNQFVQLYSDTNVTVTHGYTAGDVPLLVRMYRNKEGIFVLSATWSRPVKR